VIAERRATAKGLARVAQARREEPLKFPLR
jgi:hypothetical protein